MKGYIKTQEALCITKAIRNLGNVLILMFIALNKISGKLKINRFKIRYYAYSNRYAQFDEK